MAECNEVCTMCTKGGSSKGTLGRFLCGACVRSKVRIDCKMWNMCTRFMSYDLQTADHLHNTTTKGRDGGALWRYFTVLIIIITQLRVMEH